MKRRDFLKTPGFFVAAAAIGGTAACNDDPVDPPVERTFQFPQGVASGDPRASSVVLWTRVAPDDALEDPVAVTVQVSETEDFDTLVLETMAAVDAASDHTLRLLVTDLAAGTYYYYRFLAGEQQSITGRTLTAPAADDASPVRLAWASCQGYATGVHSAYRQMIIDDESVVESERIQFVLHLGDFVYETVGQGFQGAIDESFQPIEIIDRDGAARRVEAFPDGGEAGNSSFALTLADYRHLYKQFLRDPDLRAARARWPFINTWDDHEFSNDSWQTQATYTATDGMDEPSQMRKVAAHQAWFEYIPANLSDAEGVSGVTQHAADFAPTEVTDAPYAGTDVDENNLVTEANNQAAIDSMTIFRSFRYGQNMELVVTDERSYRSDHPIPEESAQDILFFHPRAAVPLELVRVFDAGRTANGGNPPDTVLTTFENVRKDSPPGTMLGAVQKQWWKDTVQNTDATWKVWGNSVPMMQLKITNEPPTLLFVERLLSSDCWDGYNTERTELLSFLRDNGLHNLVVLSGDFHSHFAGKLMDDYYGAAPQPVGTEFVAAGISSNSLFSQFEETTRTLGEPSLRELITYDSVPLGGDDPYANNLNVLLMHGVGGAQAAASSHSVAMVEAASDPNANPHLAYTDTNSQGYGMMTVAADQVIATLVSIERPIVDNGESGPGVRTTATFTVDRDDPDSLAGPFFTGTPPFPFGGV